MAITLLEVDGNIRALDKKGMIDNCGGELA